MPKSKETKSKEAKAAAAEAEAERRDYLLMSGSHYETEYDEDGNNISKAYEAGDIVSSKRDLITIFGANRFKLVDDDKNVLEPGRHSRKEKQDAARDSINKVTREEAEAYRPNDPGNRPAYRENAGYEQSPPDEELETSRDTRKFQQLPAPENQSAGEEPANKKTGALDKKEEDDK